MMYIIEYQSEVDDNLLTKEIEIEANDRIEAIKKFFDMNLIYRNFIDIRELC
jgi:predicted glycosyltransferase